MGCTDADCGPNCAKAMQDACPYLSFNDCFRIGAPIDFYFSGVGRGFLLANSSYPSVAKNNRSKITWNLHSHRTRVCTMRKAHAHEGWPVVEANHPRQPIAEHAIRLHKRDHTSQRIPACIGGTLESLSHLATNGVDKHDDTRVIVDITQLHKKMVATSLDEINFAGRRRLLLCEEHGGPQEGSISSTSFMHGANELS
eukprot:UN0916